MRANKIKDDTRIALLEQLTERMNITMGNIELRLEKLDSKIDDGFKQMNSRIWDNFCWGVAGIASVLGLIAHALRWI
jgi:hypothetical protein